MASSCCPTMPIHG